MEQLIVKSKVKEVLTNNNVGADYLDALNEMVNETVQTAAQRAAANGRKTVQARDVFMGELVEDPMLVVKSKIRNVLDDYNVGGDFAPGLNSVVMWAVQQAAARAEANGRKTVQARDL